MTSLHAAQATGWGEARAAPEIPSAYRFFAAALLGRSPQDLPVGVRAVGGWAEAEARRMIASGRAPTGNTDKHRLALGLRLVYQALKAEAASVRMTTDEHAAPVLVAIMRLRHRQRAALLLRHGIGLNETETAQVLGIRPAEASRVIVAGLAAAARSYGRPVDVPRALRRCANAKHKSPTETPLPGTVLHLPRGVVRTLLAPVPEAPVPEAPVPEAPVPQAPTAPESPGLQAQEKPAALAVDITPEERHVFRRRGWSLLWRAAATASMAALFGWAVWPVH